MERKASRVARKSAAKPVLLSGGNPQIAKADGDGPVQTYIAAMPGWEREVGRRLDALIERYVSSVRKAVRRNSRRVGSSRHPICPGSSGSDACRWLRGGAVMASNK